MSKKKKDKLLLNLLEGQKHRHRVAMVTEEGAWNQHEPNSGMARMFVIMLLIHVVVIGGIIVYDFINGEEVPAEAPVVQTAAPTPSALPPSTVSTDALEKEVPIEEYDTYEWKSGDSLPLVAQKLRVTEAELIRLNLLDKGAQLDQNTILRVPKRPLVKAVGLNVAGANGVAPQVAAVVQAPTLASDHPADMPPLSLTVAGDDSIASAAAVTSSPPEPAAASAEAIPQTQSLVSAPVVETTPPAAETKPVAPKVEDQPPAPAAPQVAASVPKALPVPRPAANETPAAPKVADAAPAKKTAAAPKAKGESHVVKPGETLYRIAGKYGVTVAALQKANSITKPELLRDGMKLVIPAK